MFHDGYHRDMLDLITRFATIVGNFSESAADDMKDPSEKPLLGEAKHDSWKQAGGEPGSGVVSFAGNMIDLTNIDDSPMDDLSAATDPYQISHNGEVVTEYPDSCVVIGDSGEL